MPRAKRSRRSSRLSPVHPGAASIDVGATVHVAAVGPDRDKEPVRTFRTFTAELHSLADWFARPPQAGRRPEIVLKKYV